MSKLRPMKPGPISAKPLSLLLNDVFAEAYAKQGFAARELVTRWAQIAGPEIAAHAEPLKMQWPRPVEGQPPEPATLELRVEGPMALEIQHSADVILQRGNRFFRWTAVGRPAAGAGDAGAAGGGADGARAPALRRCDPAAGQPLLRLERGRQAGLPPGSAIARPPADPARPAGRQSGGRSG